MHKTLGLASQDRRPTAKDDRSRWIALLVLCVGMLMIVLDATVVNAALPAITRSEHPIGQGEPTAAALTNGYRLGFLIAAGLVVAAIAVAVTVLRPERRAAEAPEIQPECAEAA